MHTATTAALLPRLGVDYYCRDLGYIAAVESRGVRVVVVARSGTGIVLCIIILWNTCIQFRLLVAVHVASVLVQNRRKLGR